MKQRFFAGFLLIMAFLMLLSACQSGNGTLSVDSGNEIDDSITVNTGEEDSGTASTDAEGREIWYFANLEPLLYDDEGEPTLNNIRISGETVYVEWYVQNEWTFNDQPVVVDEWMLHEGTLTFSEDGTALIRITGKYQWKLVLTGEGADAYRADLKASLMDRTESPYDEAQAEKAVNGEYAGVIVEDTRIIVREFIIVLDEQAGTFKVTKEVVSEDYGENGDYWVAVYDDIKILEQSFRNGVLRSSVDRKDDGTIEEREYAADGITLTTYRVRKPDGYYERWDYHDNGECSSYLVRDAEGGKYWCYDEEGNVTHSQFDWHDAEGRYYTQSFYADGSLAHYVISDGSGNVIHSEDHEEGEYFLDDAA